MVSVTEKIVSLSILIILLALLIPISDTQQLNTRFTVSPAEAPDYWPTEGWQQSTPQEQGMNATLLSKMIDFSNNNWNLRSILIIRNGYMVLENFIDSEYNESSLTNTYSCTKSIISILVGIAIDKGYIDSIDESIVSFFPNRTIANLDSRKESITLKHLLSMTSGLDWDESVQDQMKLESDWIQYTLDRPMAHTPSETWSYCGGGVHLLSSILNSTTGVSPLEFAETYLFHPLGISNYSWEIDAQGLEYGGGGLHLKPRDMVKIGFLCLNNGTWDAEQIISANWVANSTQAYSSECDGGQFSGQYGYLWWIKSSYKAYCAFGLNGQFIWVLPEYSLVIVMTANWYNPYEYLITDYILPSLGVFDYTTISSDTTTTTDADIIDPLILPVIIGSGIAFAVVLVLVFMKRK